MSTLIFSDLRMTEARPIASSPTRPPRKPTADHDPLGVAPGLQLEELPGYLGQFLGEVLDRAVQYSGRFRMAAGEQIIEGLLAELVARLVTERVLFQLAQRLTPFVDDAAKSAPAGPVADEALLVGKLDIVAVDHDLRETLGAMRGERRLDRDGVGHARPRF